MRYYCITIDGAFPVGQREIVILFMTTGRLTIPRYSKKKKKDEVNRETGNRQIYCEAEDMSRFFGA